MHLVFGGSGPVGTALAIYLAQTGQQVKAISRKESIAALEGIPNVTCAKGDALNADEVHSLCKDASCIYCCIGLPYDSNVWERDFPIILENLLAGASANNSCLVWADNLYCFGPESEGKVLKESSTDFTTSGRKPSLRARMDKRMLEAAKTGEVNVAIVRASDFFGPRARLSQVGDQVFGPLLKGGSVPLVVNARTRHTFTYAPDFAKALAFIGLDKTAWNRAWHVPNSPPITLTEFIDKIVELENEERKANSEPLLNAKTMEMGPFFRRVVSLFIKPLREMPEMNFLFNQDYIVDSSEFEAKFPNSNLPTPFEEAIKETTKWFKENS